MAAARNLGNLNLGKTVFFLCDMQEKFRPAIKYFPEIVEVAKRMLDATRVLDIPLIVTEQYPKGLGSTVSELDISNAVGVFPKTKFSMVLPEVIEKMSGLCGGDVKHVVLFGIEAHVCIQQTAIDLLERGIDVHIIADACSSRSLTDRMFAYKRLCKAGAIISTSESTLLQLVGDKDHGKFKQVQALIMASAPDTGLLNKL